MLSKYMAAQKVCETLDLYRQTGLVAVYADLVGAHDAWKHVKSLRGRRGPPPRSADPKFLAVALDMRLSQKAAGERLGVHEKTIGRIRRSAATQKPTT